MSWDRGTRQRGHGIERGGVLALELGREASQSPLIARQSSMEEAHR